MEHRTEDTTGQGWGEQIRCVSKEAARGSSLWFSILLVMVVRGQQRKRMRLYSKSQYTKGVKLEFLWLNQDRV